MTETGFVTYVAGRNMLQLFCFSSNPVQVFEKEVGTISDSAAWSSSSVRSDKCHMSCRGRTKSHFDTLASGDTIGTQHCYRHPSPACRRYIC